MHNCHTVFANHIHPRTRQFCRIDRLPEVTLALSLREMITKFLQDGRHSTARSIALGIDCYPGTVTREVRAMHAEGLLGAGIEPCANGARYVHYWLAQSN